MWRGSSATGEPSFSVQSIITMAVPSRHVSGRNVAGSGVAIMSG